MAVTHFFALELVDEGKTEDISNHPLINWCKIKLCLPRLFALPKFMAMLDRVECELYEMVLFKLIKFLWV